MSKDIVNRVAKSSLITIDLEEFYPKGLRTAIDIKQWLFHELILKEADFRNSLEEHHWEQYKDQYVALTCSADAIIPSWAYMLVSTYLHQVAKKVVVGSLKELETAIFQDIINELPIASYENRPLIIKGCANKPIPETAYILLIEKLQPIVKSIMFGEACSTVPLFKKPK